MKLPGLDQARSSDGSGFQTLRACEVLNVRRWIRHRRRTHTQRGMRVRRSGHRASSLGADEAADYCLSGGPLGRPSMNVIRSEATRSGCSHRTR